MTRIAATLGAFALFALTLVSGAQDGTTRKPLKQPNAAETEQSKVAETGKTAQTSPGQQVFQRNCARCHAAPQGFPASISGTVALHMRVRAGLSDKDYKALLEFLNP